MAKKVEFTDLGIGKLKEELERLKGSQITIGYQGASGSAKHPDADATVATVAAWQEYGTPEIHPRPFLRTAFDLAREQFQRDVRRALSDLIDGRVADADAALTPVGNAALRSLRNAIDTARTWAEPLSGKTIQRKGHAQPLVDSGTLRDKASWAVRQHGSVVGVEHTEDTDW